MKNKLKLSPQVSNKVSVKHTILYIGAGVGLFALLFVSAFFYLNLGNSEKAVAAVEIEIKSKKTGNWEDDSSWDAEIEYKNGLKIIIQEDHGITISKNTKIDNILHIEVYGTLNFNKGKITLPAGSTIILHEGGSMESHANGNNDQIKIGTNDKYKGTVISGLVGPIMLDKDSPIGGSPYTPSSSTLPIVLDYFKTIPTSFNTVLVEWSTFSEKNNDFFTLERSIDGKHFEPLLL